MMFYYQDFEIEAAEKAAQLLISLDKEPNLSEEEVRKSIINF